MGSISDYQRNFIPGTPEIMTAWEMLINAPPRPHDKETSSRLNQCLAVLKEAADRVEAAPPSKVRLAH